MSRPRVRPAERSRGAGAAIAVVVVTVVSTAVVGAAGSRAVAAPSDSTTVSLEVVGTPGRGLHLSVAPEGGVSMPAGLHTADTALTRAVVRDDRGGGAREWIATVGTTGMRGSSAVSYKVAAVQAPDTGTALNRTPDWSPIHMAREVVAASGLSGPWVTTGWHPHVRIASPGSAPARGALVTSVM